LHRVGHDDVTGKGKPRRGDLPRFICENIVRARSISFSLYFFFHTIPSLLPLRSIPPKIIHQDHADQLLLVHGRRAARGKADEPCGRADTDYGAEKWMSIQRDGDCQGGAGILVVYLSAIRPSRISASTRSSRHRSRLCGVGIGDSATYQMERIQNDVAPERDAGTTSGKAAVFFLSDMSRRR